MKLGYVEAVTTAVNCNVGDLYRIWLFGSVGYKHTPRCAAHHNRVKTPDENDLAVMNVQTLISNISAKREGV